MQFFCDTKKPDGPGGRRVFFAALSGLLVAAAVTGQSPIAGAQDNETTVSLPQEVILLPVEGSDLHVPRPRGWRVVEPIDESAALVFRAARDRLAQIEVRASEDISSQRLDRYLRAFEQGLLESGFQTSRSKVDRTYEGTSGSLYEYRVEVDDDVFLLLCWHVHRRNKVWTFTAFFRESRRDPYVETFEWILEHIDWGD